MTIGTEQVGTVRTQVTLQTTTEGDFRLGINEMVTQVDANQVKLFRVTDADLIKLNEVTSTSVEINKLTGFTGTVTELNLLSGVPSGLSTTEIGFLDGVTSSIQTQFNVITTDGWVTGQRILDGTITDTEINTTANISATKLGTSGFDVTDAEFGALNGLNTVDNIQTQLNARIAADSPTLTGTPLTPTAAVNNDTMQIANTAFVQQEIGHVIVVEAETNGDPIAADFTSGALLVVQF